MTKTTFWLSASVVYGVVVVVVAAVAVVGPDVPRDQRKGRMKTTTMMKMRSQKIGFDLFFGNPQRSLN